jgi:hypothetical protein
MMIVGIREVIKSRYHIIFKPGRDLPWFESDDPLVKESDFSDEFFRLFFTGGYIDRNKINAARRAFDEEQGLVPDPPRIDPAQLSPQSRRKILQYLSRSIAFRRSHIERIAA